MPEKLSIDGGTILELDTVQSEPISGPNRGKRVELYFLEGVGFRFKKFGEDAKDLGSGGGGLSDWSEDIDGNLLPNEDGTQSLGSTDFMIDEVFADKFGGVAVRHGAAAPDSGGGVSADVPAVYFREDVPGSIWTKVGPDDTDWARMSSSDVTEVLVLPDQSADPEPIANNIKLYGKKDESDVSMLFCMTSDGTVFQITTTESGISIGDAAGGDLGGTLPSPSVVALTETSGPTSLVIGDIADGQFLARSGASLIGVNGIAGIGTNAPSLTGPAHDGLEFTIANGEDDGEGDAVSLHLQAGVSQHFRLNVADPASGTAYYTKPGYTTFSASSGMGLRWTVDADASKEIYIDSAGRLCYAAGALYISGPVDGGSVLQLDQRGTDRTSFSGLVLSNAARTAFMLNCDIGDSPTYFAKANRLALAIGAGGGVLCNVNGTVDSGFEIDESGYMTINAVRQSFYGGAPVAQGVAVTDAAGGVVVDAEARAAINALLARIRAVNLIAT